MLLDCWSYPGFGDFKEKWTMPAFVQGFWQSHDLYSQSQGQKVLASSVPHPFRGGTAEWEGCSDLGAFSWDLTLVLDLILYKSCHIPKSWCEWATIFGYKLEFKGVAIVRKPVPCCMERQQPSQVGAGHRDHLDKLSRIIQGYGQFIQVWSCRPLSISQRGSGLYKDTIYKLPGIYLQLDSLVMGMCRGEVIELEQKNHVGLLYMALFSQRWIPISLSFTQKHEKDSGLMKQYECYKVTWLNNKSLRNLMGKSLARRDAVSFS